MTEAERLKKIERIEMHKAEWKGVRYDATINSAVAKTLGDADMLKGAKALMVRAIKALDTLEGMITDLQPEEIEADAQPVGEG